MNPKALLFDKFLKEEEITSFERKDFDDETALSYIALTSNLHCGICLYSSFLITVFIALFV